MTDLYSNVDVAALQADADSCLLNFGTSFHPEIITGTKGLYLYTATGHKMLDWTSGQMSCLLGHGNPEIVDTIYKHANRYEIVSTQSSARVFTAPNS